MPAESVASDWEVMIIGIRCLGKRKKKKNLIFPTTVPHLACLLSLHPNLDHPLGWFPSCQAAWCLHVPYREGAGRHIASWSLWLGKVVRPLGLVWQA